MLLCAGDSSSAGIADGALINRSGMGFGPHQRSLAECRGVREVVLVAGREQAWLGVAAGAGQLRPLAVAQLPVPAPRRRRSWLTQLPSVPVMNPQIFRDLGDRLAGLPDQPDRAFPEVAVELPS